MKNTLNILYKQMVSPGNEFSCESSDFQLFKKTLCILCRQMVFSPEWVLRWVFSWPVSVNDLKHSLQVNGFSPEWLLRCFFISPPLINDWEHALQVNGFSPECVPRWILREYDRENDLEHSLQINGFSPECVQRCLFL